MSGSPDVVTVVLALAVPIGGGVFAIVGWILKDVIASLRKSIDDHAKEIATLHVKLNEHDVSLARHGEARAGNEKDLDEIRDDMRDLKVGVAKLSEQIASLLTLMKTRPSGGRSSDSI